MFTNFIATVLRLGEKHGYKLDEPPFKHYIDLDAYKKLLKNDEETASKMLSDYTYKISADYDIAKSKNILTIYLSNIDKYTMSIYRKRRG